MMSYYHRMMCLGLLLMVGIPSYAQKNRKTRKQGTTPTESSAKIKTDLIDASKAYKVSLEKVLVFEEQGAEAASKAVEKKKEMLALELVSKKDLEESERVLAIAQDKVNDTKRKIGEADNLIAETTAEEKLSKLGPGTYVTTAALIRYNGTAHWVLTDAAKVQGFFALKFNHALPISAFGQTAVHDHMGFDHRNSIDVALSPDSSEGQTLMAYLRSAGIPFIAFRYAVPGSATGAHIHIGYPSHRVSK